MRNIICPELKVGKMLEKDFPLPISEYIERVRTETLNVVIKHGLVEANNYYWSEIHSRLRYYRRWSEVLRVFRMAERNCPI